MNFGIFVVFWLYGIFLLIGLMMVCCEYIASTFPTIKFSQWWRKHIVADGNKYPFD